MRRSIALALTFLLAATALAGCADPDAPADGNGVPTTDPNFPSPTPTPTATPTTTPTATPTPPTPADPLDSSTYALAVSGMPTQVLPNTTFNFTLYANGSVSSTSDHIGAHYADNDTVTPPEAPGRGDCEHQAGTLPGTFLVNCTLTREGSWFVWGHARVNDSGELRNWWTPAASLVKVRTYELNASNFPTNPPTGGQNFTFTLRINGTDNTSSDHLGAHYWNATTTNPTAANSMGACAHQTVEGVVGTFTVTCNIPNVGVAPRDFFVRGHLRITEGDTVLNWWTDEVKVSVLGVPESPL